jgi:hypothetical protein
MMTPLVLIVLGTLCRVVPHPPNAVALGAVALFAGAKLPRRWAWLVPVLSMMLADLILDRGTNRGLFEISRLTIYGTYVAITFLGLLARRATETRAPLALVPLSLAASGLFFLTTNFAEWIAGPLKLYPITASGLMACYTAAIPFFGNTVAADLAGVVVLFGFDALARRVASGRRKAEPVAELVEA